MNKVLIVVNGVLTDELRAKIVAEFGEDAQILTPAEAEQMKLDHIGNTPLKMNEVFEFKAQPIIDMPFIDDCRREPKHQQQQKFAQQHFNRKMNNKFRK